MLAEEEVSTLEQTLMEEERLVEFMSSGTTSDIIELNVSGTIMTTNIDLHFKSIKIRSWQGNLIRSGRIKIATMR